jgi:hypothetical protein
VLTLFTVPKPFHGHIDVIQRNALESWSRLDGVEILLCGQEDGVAEAASEFGASHLPEVALNEFGTPLVGSAFRAARRRATNQLLCFANADIIFLPDLLEAARRISDRYRDFLAVGQRWNLDLRTRLDLDRADWDARLRSEVERSGRKDLPWGSDYFLFPTSLDFGEFPPFAVGRPRWDNWLIYRARMLDVPTIDASARVTAVHQLHDYTHVPDGEPGDARQPDAGPEGPEARASRALARATMGPDFVIHLHDATHLLTPWGLLPAYTPHRLLRRWRVRKVLQHR